MIVHFAAKHSYRVHSLHFDTLILTFGSSKIAVSVRFSPPLSLPPHTPSRRRTAA